MSHVTNRVTNKKSESATRPEIIRRQFVLTKVTQSRKQCIRAARLSYSSTRELCDGIKRPDINHIADCREEEVERKKEENEVF